MTSQPEASEIMGPARRNLPLYLADLNRCLPSSALSREGRLFGWRMIDYETENFEGVMLRAGPETAAAAVEYPLELRGWHDVYLGLFNTAWRPYLDQRLWVKLAEDPAFSCLFLQAPSVDKGQVVQDLFWRTADLTGQNLSFKQVATELIPAGHPCRSTCDTVWVAYIKLVPLDADEVEALQSDREQTGTRRLFATQDWGSGFAWDAGEGAIRDMLEAYRHTDFSRIYWEGAAGDLCSYFSRVARTWTPGFAQMEDYPVPAYRRIVENFTEYEQRGIDPFRVAIDYSHELGLEFHASYRFCEGMGPFHFSPPFDQINRGGFYDRHPELRAVRRDGSRAPRISLSYPETREFLISLFLEMAEYPVDGISILFNRRPPYVEYEPPLVEGFREEYGQDPRKIDEKDPRWLRYRASVLTDFMRELRERLQRQARSQGRSRPAALSAWVFGSEEENLFYAMDVPGWIREGLIDGIVPYTSAPGLYSWELAWEKAEDIEYWLSLTRGTECELALNIMPRALSPEQYRRKSHQLLRAGVPYLAFWDSSKTWAVDKIGEGSFQHLRRLGHTEELAAWIRAGEPSLVHASTPLTKVGEWEMTFIAE